MTTPTYAGYDILAYVASSALKSAVTGFEITLKLVASLLWALTGYPAAEKGGENYSGCFAVHLTE